MFAAGDHGNEIWRGCGSGQRKHNPDKIVNSLLVLPPLSLSLSPSLPLSLSLSLSLVRSISKLTLHDDYARYRCTNRGEPFVNALPFFVEKEILLFSLFA